MMCIMHDKLYPWEEIACFKTWKCLHSNIWVDWKNLRFTYPMFERISHFWFICILFGFILFGFNFAKLLILTPFIYWYRLQACTLVQKQTGWDTGIFLETNSCIQSVKTILYLKVIENHIYVTCWFHAK